MIKEKLWIGKELLLENYYTLFPSRKIRPMIQYLKDTGRKDLVGIEIGVAKGNNSLSILKNLPIEKLFLIDPYVSFKQKGFIIKEHKSDFKIVQKKLRPYAEKVLLIHLTSSKAIKGFKKKVDFVYIDGNHEYEHINEDIVNYKKIVKKDGIIGGHDFNAKYINDVCKAVFKNFPSSYYLLHGGENDWWVTKK